MRKLRSLLIRLAGPIRRQRRERELAEEFESNLAMHVEDNMRDGMTAAEAWREARLKFGSVDSAKEAVRDRSTLPVIETTWRDFRYAVRGFRKSPGFAATAIVSLALGIGASVAIFTVTDNLLLRPLPYRQPDQLVMVWESNSHYKDADRNVISPANYRDWKAQNTVFADIAAFGEGQSSFSDGTSAEQLDEQVMTAGLLPMLGVQPVRGRLFTAAEDVPQAARVALISYRLWQRWFGGAKSAIGRQVQIASRPVTIIGVLPAGFYFRNRNVDVWEPLRLDPARDYRKKSGRYLMSVARLKSGVARDKAQAQMTAIALRLERDFPAFDTNWRINVEPFRESLVSEVRTSMLILLGGVGLLLAAACANTANLLLARYTSRRRELAVRVAIGAGRARVMRQLLAESIALSLAGGILGVVLARFFVSGLLALAPAELARNASMAVDYRVVLFAVGISFLTGVAFGLGPTLMASRTDVARGLQESGRSSVGGSNRLRSGLVAAEVALSVILLAGAGLLFQTLIALQAVDPGLNPARVLTFNVQAPPARYRQPVQAVQFFTGAADRMAKLPGVESVSAVSYLPFTGIGAGTSFSIDGRPPAKPGEEPGTVVRTVLPGYFHTIGIPLLKGRVFTAEDNTLDSPYRFVVNRALVQKYFAKEDPLGRRISVEMDSQNPFGEIIGVVGDVKEDSLQKEPQPTVYYVHAHLTYSSMTFVLRAKGDPLSLTEAARGVIRGLDAALPMAQVRTMESVVRETFARQRFSGLLLAAFSLISLVLAAVGLYGVLAYSVTERTREIGVRLALGAEPRRIMAQVLGSGVRVVIAGIVVGIAGASALTGLLRSLLFGVGAHDFTTFASVPLALLAVAVLASYVPARRAARTAPAEALRAD